jgi:hypothetical protein
MVHSGCPARCDRSGTPFIFKEPLGQAREVKVALSGLFGRFVARAYLERYLNLSIFAHLTSRSLLLDGRRRIDVVRRARVDLPDWVACAADLTSLTVAEAKGGRSLQSAHQGMDAGPAHRRDFQRTEGDDQARRDRHALGAALNGPAQAYLSVRDPVDEGEPIDMEDKDAVFIGLLRHQIANLIEPRLPPQKPALALRCCRQALPRMSPGQQSFSMIAHSNSVSPPCGMPLSLM